MEKKCPSSSSRTDRKTIEKNRRNLMKGLYSKLNSLVPHQPSKEATSLPDQLDDAANYIKKLQIKLERLREKKERLQMGNEKYGAANNNCKAGCRVMGASMSPQIEIHETGSALEVVLVTGLDWQFMFEASIRVLHEEGADIVNASFSVVEDTIFHTIHSKIGGESSPGSAGARISERLKRFVNDPAGAF